MYGKLENGKFKKAKHFIIAEGVTIINPTDEMYEKHGYKKLKEATMPDLSDNDSLVVNYVETEKEIMKVYKVVKIENDDIY